ncbi:MAG: autotransporter-associated beta strand repeat-containing protein [Chthoniobacteraceae bacterium]
MKTSPITSSFVKTPQLVLTRHLWAAPRSLGVCAVVITTLAFLPGRSASAATSSWVGADGADWNTSTNWSATKPGSADTALINTAVSTLANASGNNQSVSSITFDTNSSTMTVGSTGGNQLILSNNGKITLASTLVGSGKTITINSPLVLTPASSTTAGAYSFVNSNTDSSNTLVFGGSISSAVTSTATTLTLDGVNTGNNTISGVISNGSATTFALTKTGAGTWILTGANTYNGVTTINAGTLAFSGNGTLASTAGITLGLGATLTINNTAGIVSNRLNNQKVTISTGASGNPAVATLNYISGEGDNAEKIGTLQLNSGGITGVTNINLVANTTGTTALTIANISRGVGSTVVVSGSNLGKGTGAGYANLYLTTPSSTDTYGGGGAAGSTTISIASYILGQDTALTGDDQYGFVTVSSAATSNGMRLLSSSEYASTITGGTSVLNNVNLTSTISGLSGNTTINSLRLASGGGVTNSGTLVLNSGAILALTGNTGISNGTLFAGSTGNQELVVQTIGDTVISSNITSKGVTKSGSGTLTLSGTVNSTSNFCVNSGNLTETSTGVLNLGANALTLTSSGTSLVILAGSNSYTGATTANAGVILNLRNNAAIGTSTLTANMGSTVQLQGGINVTGSTLTLVGYGAAGQNGALVNVSGTNSYAGAIANIGNGSVNGNWISSDAGLLQFTNTASFYVGSRGLSLTGAGNGTIAGAIVYHSGDGGVYKYGPGTWTLTGANTATAAWGVYGGTLQIGDGTSGSLASGSSVVVIGAAGVGAGTLNFKEAAGATQTTGSLTFAAGDGTVQSTYGGSGTTSLTFTNLLARTAGATGNFVVSNGVNGTSNKIALTQVAGVATSTGTLLDKGYFFGGNSYAAYDTGGYLRAYNYATDTGGVTTSGGATFGATTAASNVQMTGDITAQTSGTINTLNLNGNNNLTLASGTLVVNGILKSGNIAGGSTISGGAGLSAASGAELVVRTDGANDTLTINSGILANGANALTKSGAGTLILNGTNTYSGATYVDAGKLVVNGDSSSAKGAISVLGGASLGGQGTIGGVVTLAASPFTASQGAIDLTDGSIGTLTLSNTGTALIVGGTSAQNSINSSNLTFELGNTADKISLSSGKISILGGGATVNITGLGITSTTGNQQTLIYAAGGVASGSFSSFTLGTTSGNFGGYTVALAYDSTHLYLTETANAAVANAYWTGTNDGNWTTFTGGNANVSNWATDALGSTATQKPGAGTNVIFNGAAAATTLGADFTINSLNFTAASGAVSIGGTNALTIQASGTNGHNAGIGIQVDAGSAAHTVNSNVVLGANQTWNIANSTANAFTVKGGISGAYGLTKSGAGLLVLDGANTYSGATSVTAGELQVNGSLAASSAVNVNNATLSGSGTVGGATSVTSGTVRGDGLTLGATTLDGASTLSGYNIASSVSVHSGTTSLSGTTKSIGTLSVSANATLNANGTIDGSATIIGLLKGNSTVTGNLSLVGGTLASGNSPGITTVQGNYTMDASSTLVAEVRGSVAGISYDQVKVSGNVSLAGTLDLTTLSGLTQGSPITLIDNTGNGTTSEYFSTILTSDSIYTLTSNADYTFSVGGVEYLLSYKSSSERDGINNDVTLTVVPEPGTWAMLLGGIGMLGFTQRLRRRR